MVVVNGKKVYELGAKVDPANDTVSVDGKPLKSKAPSVYIMFHKPTGVLTTLEDPLDRPTVADYLSEVPYRVFPVGRLDWDSEGLLILTNDGDYANRIMHPKTEVTKSYLVKLDREPTPEQIQKLKTGISIVGGRVAAKHIEKINRGKKQYPWYKIVITEGKNRQIRQMFEKVGCDVMKLQRIAIGKLRIGNLERGELVYMNDVAAQRVFLADLPEDDTISARKTKTQKSSKSLTPKNRKFNRVLRKAKAPRTRR